MRRGIRLSTIGQIAAFAAVAGPLAWGTAIFAPKLADYFLTAKATTGYDLRVSRRLITYRLVPDEPISFAFSKPMTLFRILSCAVLASGERDRENGWVYGYRVEMLDIGGNRIGTHDVYSRSVIRDRLNLEEDRVRFYRGAAASITLDDSAFIESKIPVAAIRIVPLPYGPGVVGIDARVYERRPFIGKTALAGFRRRSPDEQAELARANAFPAALLTEQEMMNIARNQWRPVGPLGVEGRDYKMLVMYENERALLEREKEK
ncbi:MAG: hypothetical protein ACRCY3_08840 [Sphingorhabdus sp.]